MKMPGVCLKTPGHLAYENVKGHYRILSRRILEQCSAPAV